MAKSACCKALIVLMVQSAALNAETAQIGIVDKVFYVEFIIYQRQSTFMVGCRNASILNNLSDRSRILMDEIDGELLRTMVYPLPGH